MSLYFTDAYFSRFVLYGRALSDSERSSLSQSCIVQHGDEMFSMVDILRSVSPGILVVLPSICDPIDECQTGPCGQHQCINDVGRFQCVCHDGMTGERCEIPPDYCEDNDCEQGECVPGNGSYSCNCKNGYTGPICNIPPVDGSWSDWMEWTGCDTGCGGGTRTRTRSCDNPPKGYMGAECAGNDKEVATCNEVKCPECPYLRRQFGTTLSCRNNNANRLKECNMTCIAGKALPNGQKPFETYSCGEATNYTWVPIDKTPTCVDLSPPDIFGTQTTVTYTNVIPNEDKTGVRTAIEEKFSGMYCVASGKCSLSSTVSDWSADRKRRSAASTLTMQFTIQATESGDLAIADYIANRTETAAMTELLSTLNSISEFISYIQNSTTSIFEVTVHGVQYKLENTTPSFTLTVMCATGYAGADGLCGKCAAGTKQVDTYCAYCDVGTYQSLTGQTVCIPCPAGYTTSTYGAADVSDCNVATGSGSTEESADNSEKVTIILAVCLTAAAVCVIVGVVVLVMKKSKRRTFRDSRATGSFASLSMVRPNNSFILESENAKEKFNFNVNSSHNGPDNYLERKHTILSVTETD